MEGYKLDMLAIAFQIIGGIGLLIYGIEIMKDSLEKSTTVKIQKLLKASAKNSVLSVGAGALVTVINQKSSATLFMVINLVNAGMISLIQASGVIIGANIGTTVTAQLLAFRLELTAPCIIGISVIFWRYSKNRKIVNFAEIFLGFGIMFVGMIFMESGMGPLLNFEGVQELIRHYAHLTIDEYIITIALGCVATALLRSSSVVAGIVIAASAQGLLNLEAAMALIVGLNLGKCTVSLGACRGAARIAKRAAVIHLLFNLVGVAAFVLFFGHWIGVVSEQLSPGNLPRQVANVHTLFNLTAGVICVPFIRLLVRASDKLVPRRKEEVKKEVSNLDVRMLATPGIALAQAYNEVIGMTEQTVDILDMSFKAFSKGDLRLVDRIKEEESSVLRVQKEIEVYLLQISQKNISRQQHIRLNLMLGITGDIERIYDFAFNIADLAVYKKNEGVHLSETAKLELEDLYGRIAASATDLIKAMKSNDAALANKVLSAEIKIKNMEDTLRANHVERLNQGTCSPGSGVLFVDMISNMERAAEHMKKISFFIIEESKY